MDGLTFSVNMGQLSEVIQEFTNRKNEDLLQNNKPKDPAGIQGRIDARINPGDLSRVGNQQRIANPAAAAGGQRGAAGLSPCLIIRTRTIRR